MKSTHAFSALIACLLLAFCSCKVQNAPGAYIPAEGDRPAKTTLAKKEEPKLAETPKPAEVAVVEETPAVAETPAVEPEKESAPVVVEPEKEVTRTEVFSVVEGESDSDLKTYHVVIGSFKNQDNAKRLQARMRPDYKPIIVINEHGMYRVLLASYDDYASAKQKINDIKSQFADAWVLVQKK